MLYEVITNHLSLGMRYEIRYEHELTTGLAWYRQQAAVWSSDPLTRGEFPDQQFSGIELFLLEDIRKLDNHYYFIVITSYSIHYTKLYEEFQWGSYLLPGQFP